MGEFMLRNDFATVKLSVHESPDRPRITIADVNTGRKITLDLLEIEALTRIRHSDFGSIVTGNWPPTTEPDS